MRFGRIWPILSTPYLCQLRKSYIDTSDADYEATGLKVRSVVRLARLTTVEPSTINARLGNISDGRLKQIKARLVNWLEQ